MNRWSMQIRGKEMVIDAFSRGVRHVLLTSPTGTGKSTTIADLIEHYRALDWYIVLYSNRTMLIEQLCKTLARDGIDYGVRAAGYSDEGQFEPVQISSLPTERIRVLKAQSWRIHGEGHKGLAIVDEAHLNDGPSAQAIFRLHDEAGHCRLGVTATPLNLGASYEELLVAGNVSEGRDCGALVPCLHYGPDEPDLKNVGRVPLGDDLSENQQRKAMGEAGSEMCYRLIGRILEWRERLNPEGKPGLCFGPGVAESLWLAEQFQKAGINAAHIDGADVWIKGQWYRSDFKARAAVAEASRTGEVQIVCNRFVLREGIDWPWIEHMILAFVCGDLKTYLQIVGRGLRAFPGKEFLILQDHGGAWFKHGSVNDDREWNLELTSRMASGLYEDRMRANPSAEPVRCPQCSKILASFRCRLCGWEAAVGSRKSRPVIQADGAIKQYTGNIYRPRSICKKADAAQLWERMYYRAKSKKWNTTFKGAEAKFAEDNNWQWPAHDLPLMPIDPMDWYRRVADVPVERLTRKS